MIFKFNVSYTDEVRSFIFIRWRIFIAGLIVGLVVSLLQLLLSTSIVYMPVKQEKKDPLAIVHAKLKNHPNTYNLKKELSIIPASYAANEYEQAKAYIAIEYDSGKILAEKNGKDPYSIASLTKVMTAVTALDLAGTDALFTVTRTAAKQPPTKIGVVEGQKMTLEELLHASLMTSANDATNVIMDGINALYGEDLFIRAMNEKAKAIGLEHTHFDNPQGYDGEGNYSTVSDLAVLSHYALENYPEIASIVKKEYTVLAENENHKRFDLYNWNGLLGVYPNVSGMKIGNTLDAGKTTIVASERDGKKVLVVVLGAPSVLSRDLWASQLLDYGFSRIDDIAPINITDAQLRDKYQTWKYN